MSIKRGGRFLCRNKGLNSRYVFKLPGNEPDTIYISSDAIKDVTGSPINKHRSY